MDFPLSGDAVSDAALFGKLPCHGDFVVRGLSSQERRWWDEGLSASLLSARAATGELFETLYDRAPPWRFLLIRPQGWITGALAASMDRSGRRFPIMAARRVSGPEGAGATAEDCEAALFEVLAAGGNADALHARLAVVEGRGPGTRPPLAAGWWVDGGELVGIEPITGEGLSSIIPAMLEAAERLL